MVRTITAIIGIALIIFGFTDGMEWYRLASLAVGSTMVAHAMLNRNG